MTTTTTTNSKITRRRALLTGLLGPGYLGLSALATGVPLAFLANPRAARADDMCMGDATRAQFLVLSTSGGGDPVNANAPGTYRADLTDVVHPADASMAPTQIRLGAQSFTAARPWSTLPQSVLDRTCFFHHATYTSNHADEPNVMRLMGTTMGREMLVSVASRALAPCLGTIQSQPVCLGANGAGELLSYAGQSLPKLNPTGLRAILAAPSGPLGNLATQRDRDLDRLNALLRTSGTAAERAFVDSVALSRRQARSLSDRLLADLAMIPDDGPNGQIIAAAVLIKMNISPVVTIHLPFGGDNHFDAGLVNEVDQTTTALATLGALFTRLAGYGLTDKVTFASMNVFGRTLKQVGTGRGHNGNHHVTVMVGKNVRPGVVGGVERRGPDYGAQAIDSRTGAGGASGDIAFDATLGSAAKTLCAQLGVPASAYDTQITTGRVVGSAVA